MQNTKRRSRPLGLFAILIVVLALVAAACSSDDGGDDGSTDTTDGGSTETTEAPAGDRSINVAIVGNPQMDDIASLTPELFTAETGITVNYTILEEQTLREIVTRDVAGGGEQFDVVMIGMYEAPQFGAEGWLYDLNAWAADDAAYNIDDVIPAVRSGLSTDEGYWASPFYAESSFVMYRQDLVDAAGLEMPAAPTWDEVSEIAQALATDDMAGICLRGKPGWGDLGAAFTTVLNTYGGTWWLANDDGSIGAAQVDQPEFAEALDFYTNLIDVAGQDDASNASFNECLSLYLDGKTAMWYDATVAAGLLEADDSAVKGMNGFALAPTNLTEASGWLWSWALAIPQNAGDPDTAWEYVSWATSQAYIEAAGELLPGGWAAVPPGTRTSTYENPNYQEAAAAFAEITLRAMEAAPIDNPGTTPRPGLPGVQYVGVPEFQDVGTRCTELFSAVIAGSVDAESALADCQVIASEASN
ncbi:MAG: ABC transporter substrate-binding protein [Acidimicrobiia bacterium]